MGAVCLYASSASVSAAPVAASAADQLVDSVGICTHWAYTNTPYSLRYAEVMQKLVASNIRHVRDGAKAAEMAQAGLTTTFYADVSNGEAGGPATITRLMTNLKAALLAGARISGVEMPNEPDGFWVKYPRTYNGMGYIAGQTDAERQASIVAGVTAFHQDMYAALKADPVTAHIPVIGSALGKTYNPGAGRPNPFPAGSLTNYVEYGNFHPYPGGNSFSNPYAYATIAKYIWDGTHPSTNIDKAEYKYAFDIYAPPYSPKPMMSTETGYSTYTGWMSEGIHAKYMPRLVVEYFRQGIARTYLYEFLNQFDIPSNREWNFGLLRHDLTPKPGYTALKNLLGLMADPGPSFTPGSLDYTVTVAPLAGYGRTQYVRRVLFQKRTGKFFLVLYHEIANSDKSVTPPREITHPAMPTTVAFGTPIASIKAHNYDADWNFVATNLTVTGNAVTVPVQDTVMVLEITPATLVAPNPAPVVALSNPYTGDEVVAGLTVPIRATATDAGGSVSKVEFFVDGVKLGEDLTAPYELMWTGVTAGQHVVHTRATDNAGQTTESARVFIKGVDIRAPDLTAAPSAGLNYTYYHGTWSALPDFELLTPVASGTMAAPALTPRVWNDNFGFRYTGYVHVPADGVYTFYTNSDDGSRLYIGSALVVENNGAHSAMEKSGQVNLKAGWHDFTVEYFERGGDQVLGVSYQSATLGKQAIPASAFGH